MTIRSLRQQKRTMKPCKTCCRRNFNPKIPRMSPQLPLEANRISPCATETCETKLAIRSPSPEGRGGQGVRTKGAAGQGVRTKGAQGDFLLAAVGTGMGGLGLFAVATFVLTFFGSPLFTLTNDVIIGSAPPERAGAASGISETCAELGGALGIAFFGSIGVAIYRGVLGGTLPAGLPTNVTQAAIATLGGAVVAAQQLPADAGAALLDTARDAFVRGLVLCQVISGIGTLALAVFAWATFRRRREGPV